MAYDLQMASYGMRNIRSFMKTDADVQEILWFCVTNLRGCNVGITDGRDCAVGMGLSAVIYTPSSIKIGSGIQKSIVRYRHADR
jgi:hypothetical protein